MKKMTPKEFREQGYLQHLNRTCLHLLGLALEVVQHDDGSETFGVVWDNRDEPDGMIYGSGLIDTEKARRINTELETKHYYRMARMGFVTQPDTPEEQEALLKIAHEDAAYSRLMEFHGREIVEGEAAAEQWLKEQTAKEGNDS